MALFNMWDYELTLEQIQEIDCNTTGNLLSMSDMVIKGPAEFTEENITCREGRFTFSSLCIVNSVIEQFLLMIIEWALLVTYATQHPNSEVHFLKLQLDILLSE